MTFQISSLLINYYTLHNIPSVVSLKKAEQASRSLYQTSVVLINFIRISFTLSLNTMKVIMHYLKTLFQNSGFCFKNIGQRKDCLLSQNARIYMLKHPFPCYVTDISVESEIVEPRSNSRLFCCIHFFYNYFGNLMCTFFSPFVLK